MSDQQTVVKGPSLARFRDDLAEARAISTIGVSTAEGVSPRNARLEVIAWRISDLQAQEQVEAVRDVLRESERLPPDQHAHLIATVIHDSIIPNRVALRPEARPLAGEILLQAGLEVATRLVPESLAYIVLRLHLQRLAHRPEYRFGDDVYDRLDEVGFNNPGLSVGSAAEAGQSPLHQAEWLRGRVDALAMGRMDAASLVAVLDEVERLPDELRGDLLTRLVNLSWKVNRDPANGGAATRLADLVEALPPTLRITSLEAYFNQMNRMPHEAVRPVQARILKAAERLPALPAPVWFDRSREDLVQVLRHQAGALEEAGLRTNESLLERAQRAGETPESGLFRLFSQMSGRDR